MNPSATPPQRIAVVGAGAAGLTIAWLLDPHHHVTLFEARTRLGGHTRTRIVSAGPDEGTPIDTGFIVMNHRNYPLMTRLLERLNVPLQDSDMSFSHTDPTTGFCWCGTDIPGLFATPRSLVSPSHWRMIREILRFYLDFFRNHGLLGIHNRPQWRTIPGGSDTYVQAIRRSLRHEPRLACPVRAVRRTANGPEVCTDASGWEVFDHVVLAAHADETATMLNDPNPVEHAALTAWTFQANEVTLHTDIRLMPPRRRAWASWNVRAQPGSSGEKPVSLTYDMNRLQNLTTTHRYLVSLNSHELIDPSTILDHTVLTHPVYSFEALKRRESLRTHNGESNTWYAGAWMGNGFHEDAIRSAVDIAAAFGVTL